MTHCRILTFAVACSLLALSGSALASEGPPKPKGPKCAVAGELGASPSNGDQAALVSLSGLLLAVSAAASRRRR